MAALLGENLSRKTTATCWRQGHASGPAFLARGTARHPRAGPRICWVGLAVLSIAAAHILSIAAGDHVAIAGRLSRNGSRSSGRSRPSRCRSRSGRCAVALCHPPPRRGRRPQGHPDARRAGRRVALSAGRNLPAGQRDPPLRRPEGRRSPRRRPRSGRSRCGARRSRWRANSVRCRSSPSRPRKARRATASASCAPMTIRCCNCPAGSARAAPISSNAQHARLRARPADAALRRQRTEGRRAVRASRAQSQLLRPARPDSGVDAQVQAAVEGAGDPPGAAAHRPLSDLRSARYHFMSSMRCSCSAEQFLARRPPFQLTGRLFHRIIFK